MVRLIPQVQDGRGHARLHGRERRRQPDEPVRLEPAQLHGQLEIPGQQEQSGCQAFWTYNKKFQPHRGAGVAAAAAAGDAQSAVAEEPVQRQLDVGDRPEHVPGGVVDLLPHALAERPGPTSSTRCPAEQQRSTTFNIDIGHLHRRSGADRPAVPRRVPATRRTSA